MPLTSSASLISFQLHNRYCQVFKIVSERRRLLEIVLEDLLEGKRQVVDMSCLQAVNVCSLFIWCYGNIKVRASCLEQRTYTPPLFCLC